MEEVRLIKKEVESKQGEISKLKDNTILISQNLLIGQDLGKSQSESSGRAKVAEDRLKQLQSLREDQQQKHLISMQGRQIEFRRQSQLHHEECDVSDVSLQAISAAPTTAAPATTLSSPPTSTHAIICPSIIRRMWRTIAPKLFVRTVLARCCWLFCSENKD